MRGWMMLMETSGGVVCTISKRVRVVNRGCVTVLTDYEFMLYPASMIAAGCISTAAAGLRGAVWCGEMGLLERLQNVTGIDAVSS